MDRAPSAYCEPGSLLLQCFAAVIGEDESHPRGKQLRSHRELLLRGSPETLLIVSQVELQILDHRHTLSIFHLLPRRQPLESLLQRRVSLMNPRLCRLAHLPRTDTLSCPAKQPPRVQWEYGLRLSHRIFQRQTCRQ